MDALGQLQNLLRELFQLDLADFDFGLYRLLRLKQQEVDAFLTEQLPQHVEEAFRSMAGEERAALDRDVSALAGQIREELGHNAILESYEDALHHLVTEDTLRREEPRAASHKARLGADTYRLSYLVKLPLEASDTMLNLEALEHPFDYKLEVLTEEGPRMEAVDLVETFSFLYGLHVQRIETWVNQADGRRYRVVKGLNRDGRRILVLWRDLINLDPVVQRCFLEDKLKVEGPLGEVLINGDTATPGVRAVDGLFKRLLEEGER